MQRPRPKPGARDRFGTSLAGECSESSHVPHHFQPRPLGPGERARLSNDPRTMVEGRLQEDRAPTWDSAVRAITLQYLDDEAQR